MKIRTAKDFLLETINRLLSKSPAFFTVVQIISASLAFAGHLPGILESWFNLSMPDHTVRMCKDIGNIFSGAFLSALLAKKDTVVAQTPEGSAVIVTDEKKFPMSAKAEQKQIHETVPEPPVKKVPEP